MWTHSYLCGLGEDEFRVLHQTLQWHSHVDDLCPLVFSTVVGHKLAVPGVEDDEAWVDEEASKDSESQVGVRKCGISTCSKRFVTFHGIIIISVTHIYRHEETHI